MTDRMSPEEFLLALQQLPLGSRPDLHETLTRARTLLAPFPASMAPAQQEVVTVEAITEVFWLGPLDSLVRDPSVQNVIVPGPGLAVLVERGQRIETLDLRLSEEWIHFLYTVLRMRRKRHRLDDDVVLAQIGRPHTATCEFLRYTVVGAQYNPDGPFIYLRRHPDVPWTLERMVEAGAMTPLVAEFLRLLVRAEVNLFVIGGSGSGKTSLVTALLGAMPADEWLAIIEEKRELRLPAGRLAQTRAELDDEDSSITLAELLQRFALQIGPKRIVMGETKGGEAFEVLQAMNVGHDGSMSTIHAAGTQEACRRLLECAMQSPHKPSEELVYRQIAQARPFLIYVARGLDERRRVAQIAVVSAVQSNGAFVLDPLFKPDEHGMAQPTAYPVWNTWFGERLQQRGLSLPTGYMSSARKLY
jgi:pilus assembly protein CpaF